MVSFNFITFHFLVKHADVNFLRSESFLDRPCLRRPEPYLMLRGAQPRLRLRRGPHVRQRPDERREMRRRLPDDETDLHLRSFDQRKYLSLRNCD